jgi:putative polyketide hydroxylase
MPLEFGAQVATRWREGSVFLAGDAAHRMPPFGGRGMNTAVADAHNLGWKLASVLRGVADPSLLDSYEAERGPVGRHNVSLALARYPEIAAEHGLSLDPAAPGGPNGTPDGLLEDVGHQYASDVVAATGGSRVAHAWLRTRSGRVSTIDLVGDGFALLTIGDGAAWRQAAWAFAAPGAIVRGLAALAPALAFTPTVSLPVVAIGEGVTDEDGSFAAAYGLQPGGAVLVRPDGHVVERWTAAPADRGTAIARAIALALGHARPSAARATVGVEPAAATARRLEPARA